MSAEGSQLEVGNWSPEEGSDREDVTPPKRSFEDTNKSNSECNGLSPAVPSPWNNVIIGIGDAGELQQQVRYGYRCIASMLKQDGHILCLTLAGRLLYTGSESKSIRVWSHPDLVEYGRFKSGSGRVRALVATENHEMIFSAHHDQKIRVWRRCRSNPTLHRRLATLPTLKNCVNNLMKPTPAKHADGITCLAYNAADGLLYSSSMDKSVKVWRVPHFKCVETIKAHDEAVNAVAVAHDGLVFTGSDDSTVKVWRRAVTGLTDDDDEYSRHLLAMTLANARYDSPVKALAISPDGSIVYAGSCDGNISYWQKTRLFDGPMHRAGILRGHRHAVLCVTTVENLVLSGSADMTIRVWKRASMDGRLHSCLAVLLGHGGPVESLAGSVDHRNGCLIYSGGLDGMLKVWWASTKPQARP